MVVVMIIEEGGDFSIFVLVLQPLIPIRGMFGKDLSCHPLVGMEVAVVVVPVALTIYPEIECCSIGQKNGVDYVSIKMVVVLRLLTIKRHGKCQLMK
jgi:hypothetical protein